MRLNALPTPSLVLSQQALEKNARRMLARAESLGVALRPHVKTTKCRHIAALATSEGARGLTVSTLAEAEYFIDGGFDDITYAVCITPDKLDRAAALSSRATLRIITDSSVVAEAIADHPAAHRVLIEIDSGEHRTGVLPGSETLLAIAGRIAESKRSRLDGVLTHAGHSYACRTRDEMRSVAEEERLGAVGAALRLREMGHDCPVVSVGSTPTACFAQSLEGVTEMRPGVYLLGDLFQAGIGTCEPHDIAATVLTSVISQQSAHRTLVIDAGGLALSKDRSTRGTDFDAGFGRVARVDEPLPIPDVLVHEVHQEHGLIRLPDHIDIDEFPVGTRLRIYPNHICMTAAMYDAFEVYDAELQIRERWPRSNGWS